MATERFLNRWTVLMTLQARLDRHDVGLYEAVLGLYAMRAHFPDYHFGVSEGFTALDYWALSVKERLQCIIEDKPQAYEDETPNSWMAVWSALPAAEQLIVETSVVDLLRSARGSFGEEHGGNVHKVQTARQAAESAKSPATKDRQALD